MKDFFLFIKAYINAQLPAFKSVMMFNDQLDKSNDERTDKALGYPACLIQLVSSEVRNRSLGCEDVVLQVIFHLAYEGYKFSETRQLEDMDLTKAFNAKMLKFRGNEDDPVQFTSFQRTIINESEVFDNVNTPILTYLTMLRLKEGYPALTPLSGWQHNVIGELKV